MPNAGEKRITPRGETPSLFALDGGIGAARPLPSPPYIPRLRPRRPPLAPRFVDVAQRRGLRTKVGQLPHPRGEVAPGGSVGETSAKPGSALGPFERSGA